jgi:indolepyruvate ferredoxin oxidoreductase alpha subunit
VATELLSGNEAVARGAWEAGAVVGVGYPGTPSTETLEAFAELPDVRAEWAPNEKVALEVAAGVSMAGARTLVTMKHVGANVAADPLFTLAYTGVRGGTVLLVADDPGMHSSQNEQDSRNWGPFARVPVLEPSDSDEARAFTKAAFEISEQYDVPVIVRSTTRIAHSKGLVSFEETRSERSVPEYQSEPSKWLMLPSNARLRRLSLDERVNALHEMAEDTPLNRVEMRSNEVGIITSGVSYQYVREAAPTASVFKLGLSWPLPWRGLLEFSTSCDRVFVIEEADSYLLDAVHSIGIDACHPNELPAAGELSPGKVAQALGRESGELRDTVEGLPPRPPLMCPGCPHRGVFYQLRRQKAIVTGDIGCYTLGATPPLQAMDSCVCMGAGIGMAHGMALAGVETDRPVVGIIGDSTFAHSGITGLAHITYNRGGGTIVILDNRITAMTGRQGNPMMGRTLMGEESVEIDVRGLCASLGIEHVVEVDPHDLEETDRVLAEETAREELSVIVFKSPCALLVGQTGPLVAVDEEACTACGVCIRLGCPAIGTREDGIAQVDVSLCVGCGDCEQVCKFDAIQETGPACDIGGRL